MEKDKIICQECQTELNELKNPCSKCNSTKKKIIIEFVEKLQLKIYDSISGKKINPKLPSKKKVVEKFFDGNDQSANGDWAYKKQIISREKNYYFEEVKDSNGNIIHRCEEPLNEHTNRGSAKFKKE